MPRPWQVYILRCGDGTLYTGIARDAAKRLDQHRKGRGARYTRGRGPLVMVHLEDAATHGEALRREAAIRRLGREGKEALAASVALPERAPPAERAARSPEARSCEARSRRGAPSLGPLSPRGSAGSAGSRRRSPGA